MKFSSQQNIIVALDVSDVAQVDQIVDGFADRIDCYKIGYQLFFRHGMAIVHRLLNKNKAVFLDLKLGDIGNTMRAGLDALPDQIAMITIQGGRSVARAAVEKMRESRRSTEILLLTALSSSEEDDPKLRQQQIELQVRLAIDTGCHGVIVSGDGVAQTHALRQKLGLSSKDLKLVVPGVRPPGGERHDQRHILSPLEAVRSGADRLVIGRALTAVSDRDAALEQIVGQISGAVGRAAVDH